MTEIVMPAVARDPQPELAVYHTLRQVREMNGQDLASLSPDARAKLTPLQYSVLLAHPDVREGLASEDSEMVRSLEGIYRRGDFISINHGAISTPSFLEAIKNSNCGRIPLNWYQNELRKDVNGLGAAVHMETPLQGSTVKRGSMGMGLYAYTSPLVKPLLVERGRSLVDIFQDPRKVDALSPLTSGQYASDGLACFSMEYVVNHQTSPPTLDPISEALSQLLGVMGGFGVRGSEQLTRGMHPRSLPPGFAPPGLAQLLGGESSETSGQVITLPNGASVVLIDLGEIVLGSRKKE